MAKGVISKKRKAPSVHSRAARRATSPSIDTDKSLKDVQPPTESVNHRPSVLSIHHGAGISKKQKKGRNLSSKARKRQEKAQDRAAAIMERTERKVGKSKGQARNIETRRKTWNEINNAIPLNKEGRDDEKPADEEVGQSTSDEFDDEMGDSKEGKQPEIIPEALGNPAGESMEQDVDEDIL
ncbi:Alb1-domain-containing protein [Xylariaceae sp. FL0016]|nr:Alb1-domain-containing protein [Xylariaceae sp. FL0016]